jgi:alkylated DNA repair dioxygenase AlkB
MIHGLTYVDDWIDASTESQLLASIENGVWESSLQRRVQQFGPKYNYTTRKLNSTSPKTIPDWIKTLFPNLLSWFECEPNQIIINEYKHGQGITKHVDAPAFGPTIASLSLLSDTHMTFGQYRGNEHKQLLQRRSLIVMTGEARSQWYHYIAPVAEKRISITFRTIL